MPFVNLAATKATGAPPSGGFAQHAVNDATQSGMLPPTQPTSGGSWFSVNKLVQPGSTPAWNGSNPVFGAQSQGTSGTAPQPQQGASSAPGEGYGPGFGEQYGQSHIGQYDQPTSLETFAQQQMNGNNPYYDRLRTQGMDQINQQMAARGHYNSGGALSALGNYGGAIDAAQFQNMGNLLGSASGMGLQRQQQGQQVANSVQGLQQGRLGQQFGELSDIAHLGAGNVGGFYGQGGQQSGDAAMAGINAGANASQLTGQGQSALPNTLMQGFNAYLGRK